LESLLLAQGEEKMTEGVNRTGRTTEIEMNKNDLQDALGSCIL
jgi:hypothetical protein